MVWCLRWWFGMFGPYSGTHRRRRRRIRNVTATLRVRCDTTTQ